MMDINNITKINRELGHAKGDEVIKIVAEKVRQNSREGDIAGRYGGDEIAIILPETDVAEAKYLAEFITYSLSCCFTSLKFIFFSLCKRIISSAGDRSGYRMPFLPL